jgi:undecaprenyl-diphosphatase
MKHDRRAVNTTVTIALPFGKTTWLIYKGKICCMKVVISLLRRSNLFFTGTLCCIVIAAIVYVSKGNVQFEGTRSFWLNVFFVNFTFMGDAVFALAVGAIYLFYYRQPQKAKIIFFNFLFTILLVQLFKNILYNGAFILYFEESQYLFNSTFIKETAYEQLPSGHTALAFSLAACLSSFTKRKLTQVLLLLACGLLAFSRLYLAKHSLMDVVGGTVIGLTSWVLINAVFKSKIRNYKLEIRNGEQELSLGIS